MSVDTQHTLAVGLFTLVVLVTLGITFWAGRRGSAAEEFYTGGRDFTPMQNGFAISGDYMSAASFLGITGLIVLYGYDGLLYTVGFLVAWLLGLLQFVTTFLITWLYARHARDRRDRAALGLRWETQDRLR